MSQITFAIIPHLPFAIADGTGGEAGIRARLDLAMLEDVFEYGRK